MTRQATETVSATAARERHDLFAQHYRQQIKLVRHVVRRSGLHGADAEDAVQQAFLKAYERMDALRDAASFKAWVCAIARNICFNLQRNGRKGAASVDVHGVEAEREPELAVWADAERGLLELELDGARSFVRTLLETYSCEPKATIARLFYVDGCGTKVIATQLGMRPNTVFSHLSRFRQDLKMALVEAGFAEALTP